MRYYFPKLKYKKKGDTFMADYAIIQQGNAVDTYVLSLVVDSKSDVADLPTDIKTGSTCICLEDSSVWMLGNDKVWHEI